jgi:sulfur carrier protein
MNSVQDVFNVHVNGQLHSLRAATTLAGLVDELTAAPHNMATALNGEFVPRNQRAGRILQEGDHITCFQLIAGG